MRRFSSRNIYILFFLLFFCFNLSLAQDDSYEDEYETYEKEEYLSPLNDKSLEGQKLFVEELLDLSGYIVKSIEVYGDMHRYIPALAKYAGFQKIGEKIVEHRARQYGVTKFGLNRFLNGLIYKISLATRKRN